jgi:hypothetical protein
MNWLFIARVEENDRDSILRRLGPPGQVFSIILEFKPKSPGIAELVSAWTIVPLLRRS